MEKYNCKEQQMLEFTYKNSGDPIRFPVGTVYGAQDGPTLVVVGGMHGSEFCGIQAAIDVFQKTDPAKLRGKLVVATIYNLPAFQNHLGFLVPQDGKNPMRTFPGFLEGTYGEVMAHYFWNSVLRDDPDFVIELHGGDIPERLEPFISVTVTGDKAMDDKIEEMAQAYNIACLVHTPIAQRNAAPLGSMFGKLIARGVPAMLTEAGGEGILDMDFAKIHYDGITNVMKKMGMIEGELVDTVERIPMTYHGAIRNETQGMWYPFVGLRQLVKEGEVVGEIRDYFGNKIKDITSPIDGMITVVRTSPSVGVPQVLLELHHVN